MKMGKVILSFVVLSFAMSSFGVDINATAAAVTNAGDVKDTILRFRLPILTVRQRINGKWQGGCSFLPLSVSVTGGKEPLRISFSDDTPGGSGETIRNSLWTAALIAALQKESALQGVRISLDFKGGMDGPSAGAMMCLGIMTALDGREFPDDFAMTGAILPDGTVGLVGGVPEKMKAAAKNSKIKRIAIPAFQRFDCDSDGKWTDLYELGQSLDLEVRPVESIGDAYRFLHGEVIRPEPQTSALSVCRETFEFEKKAAEIFQKRDVALLDRLAGLTSNELKSVSSGREWRDVNPRVVEQRFKEGAIFDALNMVARADASLSACLKSWEFYRDYQNDFLKDADTDKGLFSKSLADKKMHEWPIAKQLAYVDGFRERIKDICEKSLGWRRDNQENEGSEGGDDEEDADAESWSGFVPETGSSDLSAQLLSAVDASRAEGLYRYMDRQTFDRSELEGALKSGDHDIYTEVDYDRKKLYFLMCEQFVKPGLRGVPLPILNCGPEVGSALELFRKAWWITDANFETDVVDSLANKVSAHQEDVRKWLVQEYPDYAVYGAAKRLGNLVLRLYDEAKGDGVEFEYPGWTDSFLMFLCADLFAESSALLLKLDNSTDNASFMAFIADRARVNALKSMEVCRRAGIPCFAAVLSFQKAERGRADKSQDLTSVLANYWKATMSSKALVMAFKNGKGPAQGFNGYPEKQEESAARKANDAMLDALLNVKVKPFLDSLPSGWIKAMSDAAAAAAQKLDDETWKTLMEVVGRSGSLMVTKVDFIVDYLSENEDSSSLPFSRDEMKTIVQNWGEKLLALQAAATREKIADGRFVDVLLSEKRDVNDGKKGRQTLPLPETLARLQPNGSVEISIPEWEGSSFVPGLTETSADVFIKVDGKMVLDDLVELFDGCSSWRSDVAKVMEKIDAEEMKTAVLLIREVAALLKRAGECNDAKAFKTVFDGFNLLFASEEKEAAKDE